MRGRMYERCAECVCVFVWEREEGFGAAHDDDDDDDDDERLGYVQIPL